MIDAKERPNIIPWPPILLVSSLFAGFGLGRLVPLHFGAGLVNAAFWLGIVAIAIAILMDVAAMVTMYRSRTTIMPHQKSSALVTHGIFSITRNPIYVANVLLLSGIGLVSNNIWLVIFAACDGMLTQELAIKREERHLLALFGDDYARYLQAVPRWIGLPIRT